MKSTWAGKSTLARSFVVVPESSYWWDGTSCEHTAGLFGPTSAARVPIASGELQQIAESDEFITEHDTLNVRLI